MKLLFEEEVTPLSYVPNPNPDSDDDASIDSNLSPVKPSTPAAISPGLNRLVGSGQSNIIVSYYGALDFLDSQRHFDLTFGVNPLILSASPSSHHVNDVSSRVRAYAD